MASHDWFWRGVGVPYWTDAMPVNRHGLKAACQPLNDELPVVSPTFQLLILARIGSVLHSVIVYRNGVSGGDNRTLLLAYRAKADLVSGIPDRRIMVRRGGDGNRPDVTGRTYSAGGAGVAAFKPPAAQ